MLAFDRIYNGSESISIKWDFDTLKKQIVQNFGRSLRIRVVIHDFVRRCKYLAWTSIRRETMVRQCVSQGVCLIGEIELFEPQWAKFFTFFQSNPTGILTKQDIAIKNENNSNCDSKDKNNTKKTQLQNHAVFLVRVEPDCLVFANSWGEQWGDNGFFRVKNQKVLRMQFYHIWFDETQLDPKDKDGYQQYCHKEARRIVTNHIPSEAIHVPYKCPCCGCNIPINQYKGTFIRGVCPKCQSSFAPTDKTLIRSLYNNQMSRMATNEPVLSFKSKVESDSGQKIEQKQMTSHSKQNDNGIVYANEMTCTVNMESGISIAISGMYRKQFLFDAQFRRQLQNHNYNYYVKLYDQLEHIINEALQNYHHHITRASGGAGYTASNGWPYRNKSNSNSNSANGRNGNNGNNDNNENSNNGNNANSGNDRHNSNGGDDDRGDGDDGGDDSGDYDGDNDHDDNDSDDSSSSDEDTNDAHPSR